MPDPKKQNNENDSDGFEKGNDSGQLNEGKIPDYEYTPPPPPEPTETIEKSE